MKNFIALVDDKGATRIININHISSINPIYSYPRAGKGVIIAINTVFDTSNRYQLITVLDTSALDVLRLIEAAL